MKTMIVVAGLTVAAAAPGPAREEHNGHDPAVIVSQRAPAAYDYGCKFHPHPAHLGLLFSAGDGLRPDAALPEAIRVSHTATESPRATNRLVCWHLEAIGVR